MSLPETQSPAVLEAPEAGQIRALSVALGSADYYAEHNILRREGFVTRPGNLHCAFKPGTRPLLCRPVTEETGRLLLPNSVVSHTGALPDAKIPNQAPSPGVGL